MPTPENLEAHVKLVAARDRLAGITRQLTEANASIYMSVKARPRYEELQKEWEQAFRDFQVVTRDFIKTSVSDGDTEISSQAPI